MGSVCSSCFGNEESRECYNSVRASTAAVTSGKVANVETPDPEERRRQLAEAAEKRLQQQETRGVHNIDHVKRQLKRKEEMERREEELSRMGNSGGPNLTWQVS